MAGHSKWANIRYKKGIEDKKRAKIFSKFSRLIYIAVREKGGDFKTNPKLREAIEKAKFFNMPQENIERAIKRGAGQIEGTTLESLLLEGFGPKGIALLVEGVTDNKNRTLSEVRHLLENFGGKLAGRGVLWMFERKGVITIDTKSQEKNLPREEIEILAIGAGAEDIKVKDNVLEIYTKPEELYEVKKNLEGKNIKVQEASLDFVPKEEIEIEGEERGKIEKLFEALDEHPDIQEIYSNLKA